MDEETLRQRALIIYNRLVRQPRYAHTLARSTKAFLKTSLDYMTP